tara:strand:- start:1582 stop:3960 length:2379 start_codon:yes stop_codon:yes gene_type:complete
MNIIDIQDQLKNFSEQQLISEMQTPTGSAPQFLVLSEIKRRKRVRDDFMKREAANQPTVAEEAVAAAGVPQSGIMGMSEAMAPKSTMVQNSVGSVMPQSMRPQTMPAPTDDAIPMRSGGLAQFGQELSQKVSSDTVEPFLDEVESMASDRFGVDLGDGPMQQRMPFEELRGGLASLLGGRRDYSRYRPAVRPAVRDGAYRGGGKGGAVNRPLPFPVQRQVRPMPYAEGGVVKANIGAFFNPDGTPTEAGIRALIAQESGGDRFAKGDAGERGLAQILPTTAIDPGSLATSMFPDLLSRIGPGKEYANPAAAYAANTEMVDNVLYDPDRSKAFAIDYLTGLRKKFDDPYMALAGYNLGPGGVQKIKDPKNFPYTTGVLGRMGDAPADDPGMLETALSTAGDFAGNVLGSIFGASPAIASPATSSSTSAPAPAFSGYPSQKGITSPPVSASNQEDGPVKIPPLYGDGWVTSKADYDEYVRDSRNLQQDEILNPWQYENLQRGEYLYDVEDEDLVGTQYESLMGSKGLDITVAGAAQNQQMSTSPVDVGDPAFPTLAEESAQKAVGVAEILKPQNQEAAMEVGKASAQAEKVVGEDATVEEVAEAAGEILKEENNTDGTALAPVEEEEEPDAPPPAPRGPSINVGGEAETFEAGTLASEIKALQDKLDKDRETDKYLALAQAGLALMSSKEPTLLGAVGEAGISGLTAFREAQDRYQEGVIDLINARAKLKSKTGSAFTQNQMIQRAKDLQDMAATANENGNIQRARELTIAANTLLSQAGLIEGDSINESFADQ